VSPSSVRRSRAGPSRRGTSASRRLTSAAPSSAARCLRRCCWQPRSCSCCPLSYGARPAGRAAKRLPCLGSSLMLSGCRKLILCRRYPLHLLLFRVHEHMHALPWQPPAMASHARQLPPGVEKPVCAHARGARVMRRARAGQARAALLLPVLLPAPAGRRAGGGAGRARHARAQSAAAAAVRGRGGLLRLWHGARGPAVGGPGARRAELHKGARGLGATPPFCLQCWAP